MIYRGRSDLEATEAVVTAIPEVGGGSRATGKGAKPGKRRKGAR